LQKEPGKALGVDFLGLGDEVLVAQAVSLPRPGAADRLRSMEGMRVLLTNDDGIAAQGLQTLRRALLEVPDIELAVVAPDGNRSAMARSITTRRPLTVREVAFDDGTTGYATDGTPVDCVRLAQLGLIDDFTIDLVVSGINHGANLGDDVTYSGTVAAALEAILLEVPGIAVSQHSPAGPCDFRTGEGFDFRTTAAFAARVVERLEEVGLAPGTLLNINSPSTEPEGVRVARLGKRVYSDALRLIEDDEDGRVYEIYGEAGVLEGETDTDLAAVASGQIAVTPLHFDLTDVAGMDALAHSDLSALLEPAAREVEEG
jgi:5'-nucleotidase